MCGVAHAAPWVSLRQLILDEPIEGILPSIHKDMDRVNRQLANVGLQDQHMAVLLCKQYGDFADERVDKYLVMARGEVIASRSGGEMRSKTIKSGWLFELGSWFRWASKFSSGSKRGLSNETIFLCAHSGCNDLGWASPNNDRSQSDRATLVLSKERCCHGLRDAHFCVRADPRVADGASP